MASSSNEGVEKITVDEVLTAAYKKELTEVLVVGFTDDGGVWYHTSDETSADTMWKLKITEKILLNDILIKDEDNGY